MANHAPLAPSSAARTVQCTMSVRLQQQYPDDGDTAASLEGTAAHWVLAEMVEGVIIPIGSIAENGVRVEQEMIDGANAMIRDMQAKLGPNWRALVHVEETLPADPVLHPDNWGTPDAWAYHEGTLYLWDYKFGFEPVEVYENWQLINYFALTLPRLGLLDDRLLYVRFAICQPRDYASGHTLKEWRVNAAQLRAHVNILRNAYTEAMGPNPRLRVGPECDHCSARHACPEARRAGLRAADYSKLSQPFDLPPEALGRELAVLEEALEILKARASGLEEQAMRLIKAGRQVPGRAIGYGAGRTVWVKSAPEVINTGRMLGFDLAKPPEAVTPKQAVAKGFPEALAASLTTTNRGEERLVRDDGALAARVFGASS